MKSFNLLIFTLLLTFMSCGESTKSSPEKKSEKESILDGFWVRKGTLQVVNNVTVDTLFYGKDIEGMKNVKAFSNGSIFWINNRTDENNPWTRGNGGYGKFEVTNDTLTELRLEFSSKELAINYANKKKIDYELIEPRKRKIVKKSYADNFIK